MPTEVLLPEDETAEAEVSEELSDEEISESRQQIPSVIPQVPDDLWNEHEDDILRFIDQELSDAEAERSDFIDKLVRWKEAYKAPLPSNPKHFPIFNASNLTVPVIKEIVNTIAAQLVQATLTARPRWVFQDLAPEWEEFLDPLQRFLDIASDRDMELEPVAIEWIVEIAKLGTSILSVEHEIQERQVYAYDEKGFKVKKRRVTLKDGPMAYNVPLQNFWIRFQEKDIQNARWIGVETPHTEVMIRDRVATGKYEKDKAEIVLRGSSGDEEDEVTEIQEEMEETEALFRDTRNIFKVWLLWDIDGDGEFEDIVLYYHRPTRTILGKHFNHYWHGRRPFIKGEYFPMEDRFYAEGLCEMLEGIQAGISNKHNQRSDNATLANLKMIIKRKNLKSLQPGDPLYSGKIIEAMDIWNDLREFNLAEIYPSTVAEEQILRSYGERLSGTNEGVVGAAMPVSRTTASAQLALLQEQAKRIDVTVRSIRRGLSKAGFFTLHLYNQFGTSGKALAWLGEKGRVVDAVFRLPRRVNELGFGITVTTPTSMQNKQVKRESSLALFNLMVQLYEKLLPLAAQLAPDSLPMVANSLVSSAKKFMEDTLESYDQTDPDEVLAGLTVLQRVLPAPEDLGGVQSFERRAETDSILNGIARLESLYEEAERASKGDRRVRPSDTSKSGPGISAPEGLSRGGPSGLIFGGDSLLQQNPGPGRTPGGQG